MKISVILLWNCLSCTLAYWDIGTTTRHPGWWRIDQWVARSTRFRWQRTEHFWFRLLYPWWNWYELEFRRRLYVVAGISYEMTNIGTAAILNRRTLITAANLMDPYMSQQTLLRIWALGRYGKFNSPWRYRVWRLTRMQTKSMNPEHCHGPWCYHTPRHDVCIIHTLDQMYVFHELSRKYHYATRAFMTRHDENLLRNKLWYAGSGFEYHEHIAENYKIFYAATDIKEIIDCSIHLPKWWGKFICIQNREKFPGVQNGGPFMNTLTIVGLGCFAHNYNEDSILVFTDLRYYTWYIYHYGIIEAGEYYEYAYPEWGVTFEGWDDDNDLMEVKIPSFQIRDTMYPLGKRK